MSFKTPSRVIFELDLLIAYSLPLMCHFRSYFAPVLGAILRNYTLKPSKLSMRRLLGSVFIYIKLLKNYSDLPS